MAVKAETDTSSPSDVSVLPSTDSKSSSKNVKMIIESKVDQNSHVIVSNLHESVSKEVLHQHFCSVGIISSVQLMGDGKAKVSIMFL